LILGAYIFVYPPAEMNKFLIRNDEVVKLLLQIPLDVLGVYGPVTVRPAHLMPLLDKLIRTNNGHWKNLHIYTRDYIDSDY